MNDFFTPEGTDRYFTNSLKVGIISDRLPIFSEWLEDSLEEEAVYYLTLSQEMYTPEDITRKELIKNDRPYAGWTYMSLGFSRGADDEIEVLVLDLGIIGENSMADITQREWHRIVDAPKPYWEYQLDDELGLNIEYIRGRNFRVEDESISYDISVYNASTLGNIRVGTKIGAEGRFGYNVPRASDLVFQNENKNSLSAYIGFGYSYEFVVRDIFLDGNTFSTSHSVEKKDFISRYGLSLNLAYGGFKFSYEYLKVSEQFLSQNGSHSEGILNLSYRKVF